LAVIPALLVAGAVAWSLPANVVYPDYCATSSISGAFCIRYDPAIGRYENPPAEVPTDVSQFLTATARPDEIRLKIGAVAFGLSLIVLWGLMSVGRFGRRLSRLTRPASNRCDE
jgi:hypothetical protein